MYELKFCIDSDGDFGYEHTEYDTEYENIIYFEKKKEAFDALKEIVSKVCETFHSSRGYEGIHNWFKDLKEELDNLCIDFVDDFESDGDFGNQSCYFYIKKCNRIDVGKGFRFSSEGDSLKDSISRIMLSRIVNNEVIPCQFSISKTYDEKYVKEVTDLFDKYRIVYDLVDTLSGAFNLNRDWIQTDSTVSPIPCAVEFSGVYPASWDIEDVIKLVKLEEEGKIIIMVYYIDEGGKLKPNA